MNKKIFYKRSIEVIVIGLLVFSACTRGPAIEEKYPDGKLKYRAETRKYINGKIVRHGKVEYYYQNGKLKDAFHYKNGKCDGEYVHYYESGAKYMEGEYVDDKASGILESWYENGNKMAEYENGPQGPNGFFRTWYENGAKRSEGVAVNGKPYGRFTFWYGNGKKKREAVMDGDEVKDSTTLSEWDSTGLMLKDHGKAVASHPR